MAHETADTLGEFLRARRGQISPELAGLPAGVRRRVPGLRREEVAQLAGISPEYYLRLEQGRNLNPSDQILAALASALRLDEDAVAYLHRLAHPTPPTRRPRTRARTNQGDLQPLLDSWPQTPPMPRGPADASSRRIGWPCCCAPSSRWATTRCGPPSSNPRCTASIRDGTT
ncbi:helix-turn-helix transcriptional regulator [Streptomyces sp. M19]